MEQNAAHGIYWRPRQGQVTLLGHDLTKFDGDELEQVYDDASRMVDTATDTERGWGYHEIVNETHDYRGDALDQFVGLRTYLYDEPIRTVTRMGLAVAIDGATGDYDALWVKIDPPTSDPADPSALPVSSGDVAIDRGKNSVYPQFLLYRSFSPSIYVYGQMLDPPLVVVSYSAGYDDGTPQNDGYTIPYPDWLVKATRATVVAMLDWIERSRKGPGNLKSYRSGNIAYTWDPKDDDLPAAAKRYIQAREVAWIG